MATDDLGEGISGGTHHFKFGRHGQGGMEFSELLPHLSKQADKLAMIRTVHTEAINHDPAITFARPPSTGRA